MLVYFLIDLLIISFGLFASHFRINIRNNKVNEIKWIFIFSFIILFFVSAFRGDFSTDYKGYEDIYIRFNSYSLSDLLKRPLWFENPETGYLIFQYIIKSIFNDVLFIFIVSSALIVYSNLNVIRKECVLPFLGIFLYVHIGGYYQSFNLLRQSLAIAIVLLGTKFLIERKAVRYFLIVLIASTIHTSVLIMLPFYFIAQIKISKRNVVFYPLAIIIVLFLQDKGTNLLLRYYWTWYQPSAFQGYNWKNLVIPLFGAGIGLLLYYFDTSKRDLEEYKEILSNDLESNRNSIFINATVLFVLFQLTGLVNVYSQRFALPFGVYTICFVCSQIHKSKYKSIVTLGLVVILVFLGLLAQMDVPYYFIWNR